MTRGRETFMEPRVVAAIIIAVGIVVAAFYLWEMIR